MVETTIEIDTEKLVTGRTDSRGRLNLGSEFGSKDVEIAILKVEEPEAQPAD